MLHLEALLHHGYPRQEHLQIGALVTPHHAPDRLDHLGALQVRQVPGGRGLLRLGLTGVLEAVERLGVGMLQRVDDRLDRDGGEASVPGDQRVQVERIREDALPERREVALVPGPLLEQIPDDQLVALAARGAGVEHARHLVDVGDLVLQVFVHVSKHLEKGQVEHLAGPDRDHGDVVTSEIVAELVVVDQLGIVGVEKRLDRVVDVKIGELRSQAGRQGQHARDGRPVAPDQHPAPALEPLVDTLPKRHCSSSPASRWRPQGRRDRSYSCIIQTMENARSWDPARSPESITSPRGREVRGRCASRQGGQASRAAAQTY